MSQIMSTNGDFNGGYPAHHQDLVSPPPNGHHHLDNGHGPPYNGPLGAGGHRNSQVMGPGGYPVSGGGGGGPTGAFPAPGAGGPPPLKQSGSFPLPKLSPNRLAEEPEIQTIRYGTKAVGR